jgi:hypothetical protein
MTLCGTRHSRQETRRLNSFCPVLLRKRVSLKNVPQLGNYPKEAVTLCTKKWYG